MNRVLKNFLEKAKKIHGDKYDYSRVVFDKALSEKVEIICKIHGVFIQSGDGHIHLGSGCKKCSFEKVYNEKLEKRKNDFLENAKKVHGDLYDYSKVKYINAKTKVEIICKKHGSFFQIPINHLGGSICLKCSREKPPHNKENTENFIKRANIRHGGVYDYSNLVYKSAHEKVEIICNVHGPFYQTPNRHIYGDSCPHCRTTSEKDKYHIKKILPPKKADIIKRDTLKLFIDKARVISDIEGTVIDTECVST